jgi:hypothetical protein
VLFLLLLDVFLLGSFSLSILNNFFWKQQFIEFLFLKILNFKLKINNDFACKDKTIKHIADFNSKSKNNCKNFIPKLFFLHQFTIFPSTFTMFGGSSLLVHVPLQYHKFMLIIIFCQWMCKCHLIVLIVLIVLMIQLYSWILKPWIHVEC